MSCSALLERDAPFLAWNRMALLGGEEDMHQAMSLFSDEVMWSLHRNPAWPGQSDDRQHEVFGSGWFRSVGMTGGIAIADGSLQKFADLDIAEHTERVNRPNWGEASAEYCFLQRVGYWPAHGVKPQRRTTLSQEGPWAVVPGSNLKLRLVSVGHLRDDIRLSREIELISLPGIEIRPTQPTDTAAFEASADEVWYRLRILMTFCWRQSIAPLAERHTRQDGFSHTWRSIAIAPRELETIADHHVFDGSRLLYLARGAAKLAHYRNEHERLHAAVFGYAQSFKASSLEIGLTHCVEAIERLVAVIEVETGLEREIVSRNRWRSISRVLRGSLRDLALSKHEDAAIKRSLANQPSLSLRERIERVIALQGKGWTKQDERVLAGLESMIGLRNTIVHGRLAEDINRLHIELVRSRAIFEGLFINLLSVRGVSRSSSAAGLIFQYESLQAQAGDPGTM